MLKPLSSLEAQLYKFGIDQMSNEFKFYFTLAFTASKKIFSQTR